MTQPRAVRQPSASRLKRPRTMAEPVEFALDWPNVYVRNESTGIGALTWFEDLLCVTAVSMPTPAFGRVLVELRLAVMPAEPSRSALGELSLSAVLDTEKRLPDGPPVAVTTAALRGIRLAEILREITAHEAAMDERTARLPDAQIALGSATGPWVGFRNQRDLNAHLRRIRAAAHYALAVAQGHPTPVQAVADAMGTDRRQAQSLIERARASEYLTPGQPGRAGGQLTEKAQELIATLGRMATSQKEDSLG